MNVFTKAFLIMALSLGIQASIENQEQATWESQLEKKKAAVIKAEEDAYKAFLQLVEQANANGLDSKLLLELNTYDGKNIEEEDLSDITVKELETTIYALEALPPLFQLLYITDEKGKRTPALKEFIDEFTLLLQSLTKPYEELLAAMKDAEGI